MLSKNCFPSHYKTKTAGDSVPRLVFQAQRERGSREAIQLEAQSRGS